MEAKSTAKLSFEDATERLKRLEAENAGLCAELTEVRQRLKRFEALEALLAETGRLAR